MKPLPNNQEILDLCAQLRITEPEARMIAEDLHQGDELLVAQANVEMDPAILQRITAELNHRLTRKRPLIWLRRIAAVIMLGFIALGIVSLSWRLAPPTKTDQEATLQQEQAILFDMAMRWNSGNQDVDDLTVMEVMYLYDDENQDPTNRWGKETYHENVA